NRVLPLTTGMVFIHASASASVASPSSRRIMSTTKSTACEMLPSSLRTPTPSRASVWEKVPPSNWNRPSPPCWIEQGPSPAPAITGPPPQELELGPWHAHVASDQQ